MRLTIVRLLDVSAGGAGTKQAGVHCRVRFGGLLRSMRIEGRRPRR